MPPSGFRVGDSSEIIDDDGALIGELRQGLFLVSSGHASPEFAASIKRQLVAYTAAEQTRSHCDSFCRLRRRNAAAKQFTDRIGECFDGALAERQSYRRATRGRLRLHDECSVDA